jgi:leader peptidase (prepilin peptidase)/N-methyltransferase
MGIEAIFNAHNWAGVPFHFWSVVFFVFGCMVGSFLNVCIYRLPLDLSIITPPSHCPHCKYSIPWYLNIPLVTWLMLRGRCKNCGAPISPRYFVVELLAGVGFLGCWLKFGDPNHPFASMPLALVYAVFLAGLIAATFIDLEHFIIPDEITLGGMAVGLVASFCLPSLHEANALTTGVGRNLPGMVVGVLRSVAGLVAGAGVIYLILRLGKLLFGRLALDLDAESRVVFTESALLLPPKRLTLRQLWQRTFGWFAFRAERVELVDRCYRKVVVGISATQIRLGDELFDRAAVPHVEAIVERLLSPHEAARLAGARWNPFHLLADWVWSLFELLARRPKTDIPSGAYLVFAPAGAWLCREGIPFENIFYRKTDAISFHARTIGTQFGSWRDVAVRLTPAVLKIGDAEFNPEAVPRMEVVTDRMVRPREAMGPADVKFMGAIGAFLGWQAVFFCLLVSSVIGSVVGITLIALKRRTGSSWLPYGPYVALAATIWIFGGKDFFFAFFH